MERILVVERSGLVAADIRECVRDAGLNARVHHAPSLACASFIAAAAGRIDLAIVTSFAERLPESPLAKSLRQGGATLILGSAGLGEGGPGWRDEIHYLPTPFTSQALTALLSSLSPDAATVADTVRP